MKKIIMAFAVLLFIMGASCAFKTEPRDIKNRAANINKQYNVEKSRIQPSRGLTSSLKLKNNISEKVYYKGKAIVLTYHHISNLSYGDITIKPERFESDLMMLKNKGFNVISLRDMINAVEGKGTMPDNAVAITFDDGIGSFYKYAYPLLQKYEMPGTNFIITTRNESFKPSINDTNPLSPSEISEMHNSGLIDIQSHTHDSHEYIYINSELKKGPKLVNRIYDKDTKTLESEVDYEKRVTEDLNKSRELIYKYTGQYADVLCFPFGIYNKHVIELAKKCGFNYFVTTLSGTNKQNSNNDKIFRIRSGDQKLDSEKLFNSIIDTANNKKAH